jgi:hypothetical protein
VAAPSDVTNVSAVGRSHSASLSSRVIVASISNANSQPSHVPANGRALQIDRRVAHRVVAAREQEVDEPVKSASVS